MRKFTTISCAALALASALAAGAAGSKGFDARRYLQCRSGEIQLLPALGVDEMRKGHKENLEALGGFVFNLEWNENKMTKMRVLSKEGGVCRVRSYGAIGSPLMRKAKGRCTNAAIASTEGQAVPDGTPESCFERAKNPLPSVCLEFDTEPGEILEFHGQSGNQDWTDYAAHLDERFLKTAEAARIAQNVIDWQLDSGGWPKNVPMHAKWLECGFLTKREQNPKQEKIHADERPEEPLVLECMAGSSLQKTLDAIPEDTDRETIVKVAPGRYREKVRLSGRRAGVKLVAEDPRPGKTVISWNDTPSTPDGNGGTLGTFRSYTFYVDIPDFEMDGFTVENTGTPERLAATGGKEQAGQCVALFVAGDRDVFRRCRFLGWQDTVYAGGRSKSDAVRQAFDSCYIEGTVDFIFGGSVALFWNCDIHSIQGGYVTAGSHAEGLPFGYVFAKCRVTCGKGKKTSLGRPWRPYANITFIDTDFGDAVTPQGWNEWTTDFGRRVWRSAEYGCRQKGELKRDAIVEVGGAKELRRRLEESGCSTVFDVIAGADGWRPIRNVIIAL